MTGQDLIRAMTIYRQKLDQSTDMLGRLGKRQIAKLKLERDIAEALYKSCLEAINSYKTHIRVIDAQIAREWGQAK